MADSRGRIHWYAPDPRAILEHNNLHVARSLRATIRKGIYEVRMDTAFEAVMRCCADREETWINEEFIKTYTYLHYVDLAHSVEAWQDGVLVGGLYGIALGGAFMGESMFSYATNASKVCLVALVEHLKARGYVLHDTQFLTPHLATLGATEIPRRVYEKRLKEALRLRCMWR
jgi:leucyl/phenylalanyl-tRNA--protein transferase